MLRTSKSTVFFVAIPSSLMVISVLFFGYLSVTKIREQHQVTVDFYQHPFKVSNAVSRLKSDIDTMRIYMMQLTSSHNQHEIMKYFELVSGSSQDIKPQLRIIEEKFLGDMKQVAKLKKLLEDWAILRAKIFRLMERGKNEEASFLAFSQGNEIYELASVYLNYISNYAQNKALFYEREAYGNYTATIVNIFWLVSFLTLFIIACTVYAIRIVYYNSALLEDFAFHDRLTGLLNRRQFHILAEKSLSVITRHKRPLSVLIMDIDFFKKTNDTYGHNAGDAVLCSLAKLLTAELRESDLICRWGGEEFVALLPEIEKAEAVQTAKRINEQFASLSTNFQGQILQSTISIGVAHISSHSTIEAIIHDADKALYRAKESGRNQVACFGDFELKES